MGNGLPRPVEAGAKRAAALVRRTPLRRAMNRWPLIVVRGWLNRPQVGDVLAAVAALNDAQVPAWLAGGWGVEALFGEQSRWHQDIDFVVRDDEELLSRAVRAMGNEGYAFIVRQGVPTGILRLRVLLRHPKGRLVDLHPLKFDDEATATAVGRLAGTEVPCLSVNFALATRTGYHLRRRQRRDVARLGQLQH